MSGWKLALQRLTEWGNIFIIVSVVGSLSNVSLAALNPAILAVVAVATFEQGIASAAAIIAKMHVKSLISTESDILQATKEGAAEKIKKGTINTSIVTGVINFVCIVGFYFARKPITGFLIGVNNSNETMSVSQPTNLTNSSDLYSHAEKLLWVNAIGLIPDGIGMVLYGVLRAWGDILWPTLARAISMTAIGVPLAYGLSFAFLDVDIADMMSYVRVATMLVSSVAIALRLNWQLTKNLHSGVRSSASAATVITTGQVTNYGATDSAGSYKSLPDKGPNGSGS
jgi:Na+-driven multidrug efflux pump